MFSFLFKLLSIISYAYTSAAALNVIYIHAFLSIYPYEKLLKVFISEH